jgi:hypothetical protein
MSERSEQTRGADPQRPRMEPTRPATLVVAGLAAAAVAWLLISTNYGAFPVPSVPVIIFAALAVLEVLLAHNTRTRLERRRGRPPVEPLVVARYVVLAKASSLAGALFAGFYGGLAAYLLIDTRRWSGQQLPTAVAGFVTSLALVAAALWLERACRVPLHGDEEPPPGEPGP